LPHDGGAFYTSDTIEASRPHFVSAWPPLLHAVALWLTNGGGYQQLEQGDNSWNSKFPNKQNADVSKDSFHLLFGECLKIDGIKNAKISSQESVWRRFVVLGRRSR